VAHNNKETTTRDNDTLLLLPPLLLYRTEGSCIQFLPIRVKQQKSVRAFGGAADEAERREMASVNKLSIRGVRSFSPEDAEQVRYDTSLA
jgi:hypothetical protein